MNTVQNEFIKYIGVEHTPNTNTPYFKEFACNGFFTLASSAPNIQDLITVNAKATIDSSEIIRSPKSHALEGTKMGECKALIYGKIRIFFQYTTTDNKFSLYSGEHILYFCEYITLPDSTSSSIHIFPRVALENIYSYPFSPRNLYHNVIVLLSAHLS